MALCRADKFKASSYCISKFEKLVGEEGGGRSKEEQIAELVKLAPYIDLKLSKSEAATIAGQLFGNSKTFRKGQVGKWKEHLDKEQRTLYHQRYQKNPYVAWLRNGQVKLAS